MKCICSICKKEFDRKPALIKRAEHPVCSRECQTELKKKRKIVHCVICGKELLRSDNRLAIRPNPTCSKECKAKLQHKLSYNPNITDEEREQTRKNQKNYDFIKKVLQRDNYSERVERYRKDIEAPRRKLQEITGIISELESIKAKLPMGTREVIIEQNDSFENSSGHPRK